MLKSLLILNVRSQTAEVLLLEDNQLSGSLDVLCHKSANVSFFASDCRGSESEVSCSCCTLCCSAEEDCNDLEWSANLDPNHESNYRREEYDFGQGMTYFP
jgi:hypothetical protein